MKEPDDKLNSRSAERDQIPSLAVAPDTTGVGITERVLMAEALSPADPRYQEKTKLEAMRDMVQVINNRIEEPTLYGAKPGANVFGILEAPGQFREFLDYPHNFPAGKIETEVGLANSQDDPREPAYHKFVEDVIKAATERPIARLGVLTTATGWLRAHADGSVPHMQGDFVPLRQVGANYFFVSKPVLAAARPVGMTAAAQAMHRGLPGWHAAVKNAVAPALALHHLARHVATTHPSLAPVRQRQSAAQVVRAAAEGGVGVAPGLAARIARQSGVAPAVQGGARKASPGSLPAGAAAVPGAGLAPRRGSIAPRDLVGIARRAGAVHRVMTPALGTQGAANVARAVLGHRAGAPSLAPNFRAARALPSVAPRGQAGAGAGMAAPRHADLPPVVPVPAGAPRVTAAGRLPMRTAGRDGTAGAEAPAAARDSTVARQRDVARALESYFELQARLPPSSGAGFDPTLSPAWAGLQIPG